MKIVKNPILTFIIGGILFSSIAVFAATTISADHIEYAPNISIKDKIDDLYIKASFGNATANDIAYGKTALVGGKQVTGTYVNSSANLAVESPNTDVPAYTLTEFKTGFQPKLIFITATHSGSTYRFYWVEGSSNVIYQSGSSLNGRSLNASSGSYTSLTINSDGFSFYPGNWLYTVTYYYVAG